MYVTLRVTPLDSETGWTGELWSKTNCLNWQNKEITFFLAKKKIFSFKKIDVLRLLEKIFFRFFSSLLGWTEELWSNRVLFFIFDFLIFYTILNFFKKFLLFFGIFYIYICFLQYFFWILNFWIFFLIIFLDVLDFGQSYKIICGGKLRNPYFGNIFDMERSFFVEKRHVSAWHRILFGLNEKLGRYKES